MPTPCPNREPHGPHNWAIAANPGEPGPDLFRCDGWYTFAHLLDAGPDVLELRLGKIDTAGWAVPQPGRYQPKVGGTRDA